MATINGTYYSDYITRTTGNDVIYGYGGNDYIDGRAGNDVISAGAGNDDIVGGSGVNNLYGGAGADWFIQSARGAAASDDWIGDFQFDIDRIDVSAWGVSDISQLRALLSTDSTGSATLNAFYGGYNHFLTIDNVLASELVSSDFVFSDSGARNVTGTAYADTLFGSRYADTMNGGGGNDHLLGGLGNDWLAGGFGNDRLNGGVGDDDLYGSAGYDTLIGGGGYDAFIFAAASDSTPNWARDRIADFQEDIDFIDLSRIDARDAVTGNQAFTFIGAGAFTASGQLNYAFSGNDTIISGNTDNDATPEFQIALTGHHYMIADDFIL